MALWINRAGRLGESEQKFLDDKRIYLQWSKVDQDASLIQDRHELRTLLRRCYPDASTGRIGVILGQVWPKR